MRGKTALFAVLAAAALAVCCDKEVFYEDEFFSDRKVMIFYSAGHNSLSNELQSDIRELFSGTRFHTDDSRADAVVIYTHSGIDRNKPNPSYLIYPHLDKYGNFVCDTLKRWPETTISASAVTLREVLETIRDRFPADEYGMLFSSHCTGFLPEGYYSNSKNMEASAAAASRQMSRKKDGAKLQGPAGVPYTEPERIPGLPQTKSIGQDREQSTSYEIALEDFAEAIPMKMKYIIFDACLMGGVETVWQLKDKTEYLIVSPAEVLSDGMDYITMMSYLHKRPQADLEGFCRNYFEHYDRLSGAERSATITLADCSAVRELAESCAEIFESHRETLDILYQTAPETIQRYYTYDYHWYYDLDDIVGHLGCTDEEYEKFSHALERCVVYKASTDMFLVTSAIRPYPGFAIEHYSGLSMYVPLPDSQAGYLNSRYKTLGWNEATGLVR